MHKGAKSLFDSISLIIPHVKPQDEVIPSDSLRQKPTTEASLGRLSPEGQAIREKIEGNAHRWKCM